mmetsp:Transcript_3584/g.5198  ORF Transcript_3584/g.5198 Transcript_3584/m.5198 type:complete len:671 (-) Transcript_3584:265-2277(-)
MSSVELLTQGGTDYSPDTCGSGDGNVDESKILESTLKSLKELAPEYLCPLCKNPYNDTYIVVGCHHRLCGSCMRNSIARCFNKCPGCSNSKTRLDVEKDTQFDKIVSGVVRAIDLLEQAGEMKKRKISPNRTSRSTSTVNNVAAGAPVEGQRETQMGMGMDTDTQQPLLVDEDVGNYGQTSENKDIESSDESPKVKNASAGDCRIRVKEVGNRRSLRKRKIPIKLEDYDITCLTKRRRKNLSDDNDESNNNKGDLLEGSVNEDEDIGPANLETLSIDQMMCTLLKKEKDHEGLEKGDERCKVEKQKDDISTDCHGVSEKSITDVMDDDTDEYLDRNVAERQKSDVVEDCHIRASVEGLNEDGGEDDELSMRAFIDSTLDPSPKFYTVTDAREHDPVSSIRKNCCGNSNNASFPCTRFRLEAILPPGQKPVSVYLGPNKIHEDRNVSREPGTETECETHCNAKDAGNNSHESSSGKPTEEQMKDINCQENEEGCLTQEKILRRPRKLVSGYSGKVNQSKVEISTGHSRKILNNHLDNLGLSAEFAVSVVSRRMGKISHLTFNEKWNDVPFDRSETLEFWVGIGPRRLSAVSPLNPARYSQKGDGIPIFWNAKRQGKSLCYYVGHYKCILFDVFDKPIKFKGEDRAALLEFEFVKYSQTLAGKLEDIQDNEA